jgi:two-component system KDP operon response regulator KdpE
VTPSAPCILVVDDDEDLRYVLRRVLERHGFRVLEADSLASALAAPPVELVITDLHLPDGSGDDLVDRLRERRKLPAIALTGSKRTQPGRFEAHLLKPAELGELIATVELLVGVARQG